MPLSLGLLILEGAIGSAVDERRGYGEVRSVAAPILTEGGTATALVQTICYRLGLSHSEFALRYGIPVKTLQDWAENRNPPGPAVFSCLKVIAREPELVARALLPAEPALSQPAQVM